MQSFSRGKGLLLAGIVAAADAVGSMPGNVHASPNEPAVPTVIKVPAGNKVFLVCHAIGVQIYSCNATSESGQQN